jgi:hypothetical protein
MTFSKKTASTKNWVVTHCMAAFILLTVIAFPISLFAQSYDSLNLLNGHKAQVYYSNGTGERARQIAARIDKVIAYYDTSIGFAPAAKILVLNPGDWGKYSAKGAVFGMPHYTENKTLVVASEDNPFWKSFTPPIDKLPKELATQVMSAYSDKSGHLSMQPFFDLLAIHELAHAYHNQGGLTMQRKWMGELFANILLHTYIAENEPGLLPALTVFPRLVMRQGTQGFAFTSLTDFEEKYDDIARQNPRNYGWYQCTLHDAAADIYNAGGSEVTKKLWVALKKQKSKLNDADLASFLATDVHQSVADVFLKWNGK